MELNEITKALTKYGLKIDIDSIEQLPYGAVRNTYLLKSNKDKYILKVFDKSKKEQVKKVIDMLRKINEKKELTINPIHSDVLIFDSSVGFIYGYFEGEMFERVDIENKLFEFGKIVGEFNKRTKYFPCPNEKKEEINNFVNKEMHKFEKTIELLKTNKKDYSDKIIRLFEKGISLAKSEDNISGFRICLIHGDLHFENVLYSTEDKDYRIIDVFNIDFSFLLIEIMVIISHLIKEDPNVNKRIIGEILKGYESKIELTEEEKKAIPLFTLLHKMGEVNWLIGEFDNGKISKEVFDKYMAIDPNQLGVIINQYDNLKESFN